MRSIVGEEKATAMNSGAVKDSSSQSLSTLVEVESAAGVRKSPSSASHASSRKVIKAVSAAGTNCPSDGSGHPEGVEADVSTSRGTGHVHASAHVSTSHGAGSAHGKNSLKSGVSTSSAGEQRGGSSLGSLGISKTVHELDESPEFEGVGDAYDKATLSKRAYFAAKGKRKANAAEAGMSKGKGKGKAGSRKAKGASGASKGSVTKDGAAKNAATSAAQAKNAAAAAEGAAVAAEKAGALKTIGAAVSSALAPVAGIMAGILAFIAAVLVVAQLLSALFGFWENEANKQMMEGLPPYITYEMVEAALECQETSGHPAGCTIAQIICESGQGDHMSQLAARDHNLFGIKWASSFASCPEVTGKSSWVTGEEYNGQHVTIAACFTVFKTDVDCIKFRSRVFLQQSHFKNQPAIQEAISNHDSDKMAEGLKAGGWATSSTYVESLKSIMDTYGLRRFDSMTLDDWKSMDEKAQKIVAAAESQLGVPYVWGGSTPGVGLDCSGLTQYCYRQAGIHISHYTEDQANELKRIPIAQAKPGDILYRQGHVAIFTGGNTYIHEPQAGEVCKRSTGVSYFTCALTYRIV